MLPRARLKQHGGSAVRRAPAARTQARLLADLLADLVLLLVERLLLGLGDVAAVGARHGALFLADGAVLSVQLGRLRLGRSEEHTSELQSQSNLVCRLLLEKKNKSHIHPYDFTSPRVTLRL